MGKLQNTIVIAGKLTGEAHQRPQCPKRPIMMLGARAEKARRLEEEEDSVDEDQRWQPKYADESGANE
jgi:hypothetical protein